MKKVLIKFAFISGIAIALTGCYPGGVETTSDTDLVYTNYAPDYNFAGVQTYHLSDSIQHLVDEGDDINYSYDDLITSEIRTNLDNLGWMEIDPTPQQNADVNVVTTILVTTTYNVYYYPWYPYWGWGWYKGTKGIDYYDYGWYYPYGTTYVSSYTTGTIAIVMFDPDKADTTNKLINVSWTGILNGLAGTGGSETKTRLTRGIDQAFIQSPYLKGN
jgi:hypothetical protein